MPLLFLLALLVVGVLLALGLSFAAIVYGVGAVAVRLLREAPWILIFIGVWMLVAPRRKRWKKQQHRWQAPAAARPVAQPRAAEPTSEPTAPARPKRELPIDVRVKVEQIRHKSDLLLGYADRFPPMSHELHIVRQTAADYLPRTVEAYLALDPDLEAVAAPSGGKSPLEELAEQLELLDTKLDEIAQDLQRQDLDRLLANRRFLEDRFRAVNDAA